MTLVVSADQTLRPVTHVATGSLYGLADATNPSDSLASAIKPNTFVQMPAGGHQQGTGDILVVASKASRVGAKLVDRLSDYYAGWPYQFSWSTWPSFVTSQLQKVNRSTVPNLAAYELWNESDNTWLSANGTYEDFWTRTYRQVRSIDASTPIQGPSLSNNISDMQNFLKNAVATNTVPDIISWHELAGANLIAGDVQKVVGLENSLGISPRPIAIEEYASPSEVGIPGALVGYIAKFERLGVHDAELAFWNQSGALGDLLTGRGGSPNGAYWLYTWYAAMSGNMVVTTPASQTSIDGAAALTSDGRALSVIVGGGTSGASAVQVNGLGGALAGSGTVHVKVESVASTGRTGASSGASTLAESDYVVSGGSITVPVNTTSTSAYRLTITPSGSPTTTGTTTTTTRTTTTTSTTRTTSTSTTTRTTSTSGGPAGCTAAYSVTSAWTGGFVANVNVTAGSAGTTSWKVSLSLPSGTALTSGWNATFTGSTGTVTATNASYNGALGAGQSTSFGFQGTGTGSGVTTTCTAA